MKIFNNIDFNNLPKNYTEQDVREDIIAPLLNTLGYSASNENNRIIREPKLKHPYIQFGTKSEKNKIIPDYLLQVNKKNAFIIEAKSPKENIKNGKNVAQAYSYSIHKEIQVKIFVLCNGKEFNIFEVNNEKPLLSFQLANATEDDWGKTYNLLNPIAFINPHISKYKSDYGLWCFRKGIQPNENLVFSNCFITDVMRLDDTLFTILITMTTEEGEFLASFDFDISLFEDFMNQVPNRLQKIVKNSIRMSPFKYNTKNESDSFPISFSAHLSDTVIRNENEDYLPLRITKFF